MKENIILMQDNSFNKSTAFTREEREKYKLRGLLPHAVFTQEMQMERTMQNLRRKPNNLEKYVFLASLQDRNERLFFKTVMTHTEEILPLIYTPTVGQACKEFSHIFRQTKGFYITPEDRGEIRKIIDNWPKDDVRAIVVTDGQRILGLGDLGSNGMGIPIGKLSLYVACGGIHPDNCLPVMLDMGTNNEELLKDPLYLGYPHHRIEGDAYFDLVDEFIMAVQEKYPRALIQFEDFLTPNAYALLSKYRDRILCFNDDIQGTASVALAGVYASTRISELDFKDLRIMFLGAGSAATGIADLMLAAFKAEGLSEAEAYKRLWFADQKGLLVSSRTDLQPHNYMYAQDHLAMGFEDAILAVKPHVLIGATGAPGTFTKTVIERMSSVNARPVIFALSNPTDRAECTAEQAYAWSQGRAIFASGSPFAPVTHQEHTFVPGQANNAYIFPGVGLGAIVAEGVKLPEDIFFTAAHALAMQVSDEDIEKGTLFPPLREIRETSLQIAVKVAEKLYELDLARAPKPASLEDTIRAYMYNPEY